MSIFIERLFCIPWHRFPLLFNQFPVDGHLGGFSSSFSLVRLRVFTCVLHVCMKRRIVGADLYTENYDYFISDDTKDDTF